ncbi:MAG: PGPGW domain-containing protein [Pseudomonadota bacterium]
MTFAVLFIVSLLATVIIVPLVVIKIPADYFRIDGETPQPFRNFSAPVRVALMILKNLLGLVLVLMGIAMLVLPGQGVIVILIGVLLLDFPGKQRLERWLISRGPILHFANWLRRKWDKAPLTLD